MITLYDRYETAFNTNGLGILEVYDDVVEEELNGIFKLTFKYPKFARLGNSIANGMTLRANVPGGQEPFRIWSLVDRDDVLEVTAHHISFDLYFKFIEDKNLVTLGSQAALVRLLEDTPFTGLSDVIKTDSVRVVRKSVQQAIFSDDDNSFLTRWGGEFKRTGFTLNAMNRRGRTYAQNPVSIRYGKDLVSYEATEDESTYYNRVMPIGFDGLLLPEKYVDRPGIDLNDIRITTVEYSDIKPIEDPENPREDEVPLATAYQMMRDRVAGEFEAGVYDAKANYQVEFVDLSSTVEYANKAVLVTRYIGDEIKVVRSTDSIMARVISYRYCPNLKQYLSIELGNFEEKPMNLVSRLDFVARTVTELSDRQITEQHVTDLLTSALGGYVQEYNGQMFIMDTADPMTATKVWRWNLNGLGYSGTGINGPYTTAITMDGTIVGSFISANSISANRLKSDVGQTLDISSNLAITGLVSDVSALDGRLDSAELKITPEAITQTVEGNTTTLATKAEVALVDEAWTASFSRLATGGVNAYGKNTPVAYYSGNGGYVGAIFKDLTPHGFEVLGRLTEAPNGHVRIGEVIDTTGQWTISFRVRTSEGQFPIDIDICDSPVQQIIADIYWQRFELTFDVTNPGNFVDFAGLGYSYFYFDDIKIERGDRATPWSPHPSELFTGVTRIDEHGVEVTRSDEEISTRMKNDGFSVYDAGVLQASFGENSIIPTLKTNQIESNDLIQPVYGPLEYVVGVGNYSSITEVLNMVFRGGRRFLVGTLAIYVDNDILDICNISDIAGGTIFIRFRNNSTLYGRITLENVSSRVMIVGYGGYGKIISGSGSGGEWPIRAYSCQAVHIENFNLINDGVGVYATNQSRVYVSNCDFVTTPLAMLAEAGSQIHSLNNVGSGQVSFDMRHGSLISAVGTLPLGFKEGNRLETGVTQVASTLSPPATTSKQFTQKFTMATLDTLYYGTNDVYSYQGAQAVQNRWDSTYEWSVGRIRFSSEIYDFFNGGTGTTIRMRLRRSASSHGTANAVLPTPYNHAATYPTGAVRGGWTDWANVSTALFTAAGANLTYYNGVQGNSYAKWDAVEVEVTTTKTV